MEVRSRAVTAALVASLLFASACGRGEDETESGAPETTASGSSDTTGTTAAVVESRLDAGGFGDLENVCQEGEGGPASDIGVTADSINVGTLTDKGFAARPGLNQEMVDAAVAFAAWCNEHGGINGRQLVIDDRDAALTAYNDRITESCAEDFALVGGGAVFDDADNGGRVACGLPNVAGFVVSETARVADLQVQPVPNPLTEYAAGAYRRLAEARPELMDHYGIMTGNVGATLSTRDQVLDAVTQLGFQTVFNQEYSSAGESNWRPFVEQMRDAGVEVFEWVGEPEYLSAIQEAMALVGFYPEVIMVNTNIYDTRYLETVGNNTRNTLIRTAYTPFELADENPATADYLELMERYNPGGKLAQLGAQAVSAFLLFAQAASECGADLTRTCMIENAGSVTSWTGGGMHAEMNPSAGSAPQCFAFIAVTPGSFTVDEELTQPNEGIFNCDPENVLQTPAG
jgi:ABC-type branched-subunit amino acid transport system substrate-binding protein